LALLSVVMVALEHNNGVYAHTVQGLAQPLPSRSRCQRGLLLAAPNAAILYATLAKGPKRFAPTTLRISTRSSQIWSGSTALYVSTRHDCLAVFRHFSAGRYARP
jgi:hypothetical protein